MRFSDEPAVPDILKSFPTATSENISAIKRALIEKGLNDPVTIIIDARAQVERASKYFDSVPRSEFQHLYTRNLWTARLAHVKKLKAWSDFQPETINRWAMAARRPFDPDEKNLVTATDDVSSCYNVAKKYAIEQEYIFSRKLEKAQKTENETPGKEKKRNRDYISYHKKLWRNRWELIDAGGLSDLKPELVKNWANTNLPEGANKCGCPVCQQELENKTSRNKLSNAQP